MILCTFNDDRCTVCGAPRINARQVCGSWQPGLGDYVHAGLAVVGITPERVAAALGVDDCGCEGRRAWLNEAGKALGIGSPPELTGEVDSQQSWTDEHLQEAGPWPSRSTRSPPISR